MDKNIGRSFAFVIYNAYFVWRNKRDKTALEVRGIYLTVQEMIEKGGFSDFAVLAGEKGVHEREVKTICVIDTPDIEGWIFGGEFLLSSGFIFKDYPEQLGRLIETVSREGAAALGVKSGRYIDRIPQEVLRTADRLSFPLIGIPTHYAHTDIINPALITIADRKAEMMDRTEEVRRRFVDVMTGEASLAAVLSLLREYLHRELLFVDAVTGERSAMADSLEFGRAAEDAPLAFLIDHFPHEAIPLAGKPRGYLFMDRQADEQAAGMALIHGRDALRLYLKWEAERWRIERGRGALFVQDVLYKRFRHDSEVRSRGRSLGWDFDGRHAVVLLSVDRGRSIHHEPEEPHIGAYEVFRSLLPRVQQQPAPYTTLEEGMAFIVKAPEERWQKVQDELLETFAVARRNARQKTGLHLLMGVGAPVSDILSSDKSFREAKRVVAMARESEDPNFPCFWEGMGVYKLLAPIHDTQDAHSFMTEQLGPLLRESGSGAPMHDSLLHTLFCVIKNNWQLKPVAAAMNLHYNTVKYRYRKIEEILGRDLESQTVRIGLALAMELHMLGRSERRDENV